MDQNLQKIVGKRVEKTIENLKKNRMEAYYVPDCAAAVSLIDQLCRPGETVAVGGSMTLFEAGIIDHLNSGKYHHLDRYAKNADSLSGDAATLFLPTPILPVHALTEEGSCIMWTATGIGWRLCCSVPGR